MLKKIIITLIIIFTLIICAAILLPIIYKDKLVEIAKTEMNNNLNAKVDFGDFGLSIIKNFPNFTFTIEDLNVEGVDEFDGITLAAIKEFNFTVDLMSIIGGTTIQIKAINLDEPNLHIIVTEEGKANWDIAKESGEVPEEPAKEETPTEFKIGLQKYSLTGANIIYDDREGDMLAKVFGLDHTGKGDFTEDLFNLATRTEIESLTFKFEGVNYLYKVDADFKADLQIDMVNSKYTFKDNEFRLNALSLGLDGFVEMPGDDIKMDVTFNAKKTEFKNILSLVPAVFMSDFNDIKTSGKLALAGFAKGVLSDTQYPSFVIELVVEEGMFKYPDLPVAVNNVNVDLRIACEDNDLDHTVVDLKKFHMELDKEPFDFTMLLKTPISDPDIDATMKGKIDLAQMTKAVPLEGISALSGVFTANAEAKGKMSAIERGYYDKVHAAGEIQFANLIYASDDLPEQVDLKLMKLTFNPRNVTLNAFDMKMGKNDFQANGALDNLLGYMLNDESLTGELNLNSSYMDLNTMMAEGEVSENEAVEAEITTETSSDEMFEIPENLNLTLTANLRKVIYEKTELENINGLILLKKGMLKGNVSMTSKYINVDDFMEEEGGEEEKGAEEEGEAEAGEPFMVPGNMDFTFGCKIDKVHFDNMDMTNVAGKLTIRNETVSFKELKATLLGGSMVMAGSYSTKSTAQPKFDFSYNITNFDIQQSFTTFNTMEKIAPAAKYVSGNFSSTVSIKGLLGNDMFPDYPTLTGNGVVVIPNGAVKNFEPLNKLAETLKMDDLKEFKLQNTRVQFTFKDGRVHVAPFDVEQRGIKMNVSGSHGFDESIDYLLKMQVPRKMMGGAANELMDNLLGMAKEKGVDLGTHEMIKFNIRVKGTISKPSMQSGLKGAMKSKEKDTKQKVKDEADRLKKEAAEKARLEAERLKKEAKDKLNKEKDRLKKEAALKKKEAQDRAKKEAARLKKEAEEKARKEAERKKKEAEEKLKKEAEDKLKNLFK